VDLLVLTHFHMDHVGGIAGVFDGRNVAAVLESPYREPPEGAHLVDSTTAGLPIVVATAGWTFTRDALTVRVLAPIVVHTGTSSDPNNNSVVLRAVSGGVSLMLAGDAQNEEQQDLLMLDPAELRCDVLKVAHHGSAYQEPGFLDAVAPRVALVSVGAGNPYGHPNPGILARLSRAGATVLRTDQDGDLAVAQTPEGLAVATHNAA
jgi:competence protein ComEC